MTTELHKKEPHSLKENDQIELVQYTNRYSDFEVMQPSLETFSAQFQRGIFDRVISARHGSMGVDLVLEKTGEHYVSYWDGPEKNMIFYI